MDAEMMQTIGNEKTTNKKSEWIGIIVIYVAMILVNIILSNLFDYIAIAGVNIPFVVSGIIIEIGIVTPAIIYTKMRGENLVTNFGFRKVRLKTVLLTLVLTFLSCPLYWCANVLSMLFVKNTAMESASELASGSVFGTYFVLAIVASLCEEASLRGFCFNRLRKVSSLVIATVLSAIMFGVIHLNINQMCYAIVLGIIFALANFASGSIWTSIIMHTIINSIGFVAVLIMDLTAASEGLETAEASEVIRTQGNTMLTTGLVLLVISIGFSFLIKKVLRKIAISENNQEAL